MSTQAALALPHLMGLEILRRFAIALPSLIEARSLQQRVDRKYLLAASDITSLLARLQQSHCVVRANAHGWARYDNLYFDTPDRDLYHAHRCGRRPRYKVRIRHHVDRALSFLEVKRKDGSGRTTKHRLALPYRQDTLGPHERTFIGAHAALDSTPLLPRVSISFQRLTLVGSSVNERVTLDRDLMVTAGHCVKALGHVVIAEVKQSRYLNHAGAVAGFRHIHAREVALSKYCLATLLVAPVPANVFKPALRAIERLSV
jgi:hypothetical protein